MSRRVRRAPDHNVHSAVPPCSGQARNQDAHDDECEANEVAFPTDLFEVDDVPTRHHVKFPVPQIPLATHNNTEEFALPAHCAGFYLNASTGEPTSRDICAAVPAIEFEPSSGSNSSLLVAASFAHHAADGGHNPQPPANALGTLHVRLFSRGANADAAAQGGDLTGYGMFPETEVLCSFILAHRHLFRGRRVLELGAGLALPSHVALACGAQPPVMVTDGCADVVAAAVKHPALQASQLVWRSDDGGDGATEIADPDAAESAAAGHINGDLGDLAHVAAHDNSRDVLAEQARLGTFDIIYGSGIAYAEVALVPLLHTVRRFLRRRPSEEAEDAGDHQQDEDAVPVPLFLCGFQDRQVSWHALCAAAEAAGFCISAPTGAESRGVGGDTAALFDGVVPRSWEVDAEKHLGVYVFRLKPTTPLRTTPAQLIDVR
jgi:hypothetical protein